MAPNHAALVCPSCYWSGDRDELDAHRAPTGPGSPPLEVSGSFCPVCGCHLIARRISA